MYKKPNFFRDLFSFSGQMSAAEFWSDLGVSLISAFCALIIICIGLCVAVPGEVEELAEIMKWVFAVVGIIGGVRIAALTRRRLRDGGFTAKSYFWLLLPGIGLVIFVVRRLCARSNDE